MDIFNDLDIVNEYSDAVFLNMTMNIKALRTKRKYSQEEMALRCHMNRGSYMSIEKGFSDPTVRTLIKIIYNLETDYDTIFNGYLE